MNFFHLLTVWSNTRTYFEETNFEQDYNELLQYPLGNSDQGGEHICTTCGKSYRQKRALYRHVKFECGLEAKFKCPYCDVKTKQRSNTYRHIRRCHPGLRVGFLEIK